MIVLNNNESTIRDSAQELLEDLVRRNMVISQKDMWLQELCLSKAKDENFLQIVKVPISTYTINAQPPSRSRRLSVHSRNALHILIHGKSSKTKLDLFAYTISSRLGEFGVAQIIRSKRSKVSRSQVTFQHPLEILELIRGLGMSSFFFSAES